MLLRASSEVSGGGGAVDLAAINEGESAAAGNGIAHAEALVALADAQVGDDDAALAAARARLLAEVGPEALVDSVAVVANFERMVRIADATGTPLDAPVAMMATGLREELDLDRFGSAANTPRAGAGAARNRSSALAVRGRRAAPDGTAHGRTRRPRTPIRRLALREYGCLEPLELRIGRRAVRSQPSETLKRSRTSFRWRGVSFALAIPPHRFDKPLAVLDPHAIALAHSRQIERVWRATRREVALEEARLPPKSIPRTAGPASTRQRASRHQEHL